MATDVDVQYFSHLNGLTLGNNWGDLIRLLDKALVTGVDFTQITSASIDAQGDVHITLYAAHNAMLFQVVELTGFAPASFNQKYRIKGVPNTTQLILKPHTAIAETSITTIGAGKLASLGYDIIFRDTNDVKRVYRAKNPSSEHPFIRVDESLTSPDGTTGVYTSTYAKYAMVGLLENMEHIDDYDNPDVLQLPFDSSDPTKNWKITGTGTAVVRGWSRWYWRRGLLSSGNFNGGGPDNLSPSSDNDHFTLCGGRDAFYLLLSNKLNFVQNKILYGLGLFNSSLYASIVKNWFCMSNLTLNAASVSVASYNENTPLMQNTTTGYLLVPKYDPAAPLQPHAVAYPVSPDYASGFSNIYQANNVSPLEIPISDADKYLRGNLKHVYYSGKNHGSSAVGPILSDTSMLLWDVAYTPSSATIRVGGFYFYLGELE